MTIDRSKINGKAKEILTEAAFIQASCDELDKNEQYWKLYKDFHTETNFIYKKLGNYINKTLYILRHIIYR